MGFDVGFASDVGRQRSRNEDNLYVCDFTENDVKGHGLLFAVADGMGGHQGGALASRLAIETLGSYYDEEVSKESVEAIMSMIVRRANDTIRTRSSMDPEFSRMGTTLTGALLCEPSKLRVWHIGDCRGFIVRDGQLDQITNDHSLVADQVRLGIITPDEAENHPAKNVITRALGTRKEVTPDIYEELFQPGDRLMICCDGLHGVVSADEMLRIMLDAESAKDGCQRLVERANELGGPDNITVVLVHYQEPNGLWEWVSDLFEGDSE